MKSLRNSGSSQSKYPFLRLAAGGVYVRIRVRPRASKNELSGIQGEALRVRLTSPPVEGEANRALVGYLSELLGVKKGMITIEAGTRSREKRVRVDGVSVKELEIFFDSIL